MISVLDRLKKVKADINKYDYLRNSLLTCKVNTDQKYQTIFRDFYTMNRARKSPEWYKMFFSILERKKRDRAISFRSVLEKVFKKTGRFEASFCSKLIATINPNLPVWDQHVLDNYGLKSPPPCKDSAQRLDLFLDVYSEIKTRSKDAIQKECFEKWRRLFDDSFPQFEHFTKIKKLDLFLWQYRQI